MCHSFLATADLWVLGGISCCPKHSVFTANRGGLHPHAEGRRESTGWGGVRGARGRGGRGARGRGGRGLEGEGEGERRKVGRSGG